MQSGRPGVPERRIFAALAAALAATLAGCSSLFHFFGPADGRRVYERNCASCHGLRGTGDGPVAGNLVRPPADLTKLASRSGGRFPRDHVIGVVTGREQVAAHGSREMPVWGDRFSPTGGGGAAAAAIHTQRDVRAVADYLRSLQRDPADSR